MRVLLITGAMPHMAPYLQYYLNILNGQGVAYDIVTWNRDGVVGASSSSNIHIYDRPLSTQANVVTKALAYCGFSRFVRKVAKDCMSDAVIVYTIPTSLYYYFWFTGKYKNKYIFDIRDYSFVYKFPLIRKMIDKIIGNSYLTSISSPGFLNWLPKMSARYILSHNVGIDLLIQASPYVKIARPEGVINILTIGQIRDPEANFDITQTLCLENNISMSFVGYGYGMDFLQEQFGNRYKNIYFKGAYKKEDEYAIVKEYDMINAYMPNNILSKSLMSNRFYVSVLYGKPIIVSNDSTQAYYVDKYHLGVVIDDVHRAGHSILEYWSTFDEKEYNHGRMLFLEQVKNDYYLFESRIKEFIKKSQE